ncbi:mitochondrial glycerol-3-phosphate dehydrogenase [Emydomyces testavorans]|uniref:glycerol-3-phosphate dehydrogenase n=1 Tax=Emydomyces testavorans TaxID=2070801 RepID=A0AAF0IIA0_9EURO|nr:mitochondrial glycerol-3-phosphate dehydrogenase [Emydomyces testavorans]
MATRQSTRFVRPFFYTAAAIAGTAGILYISYRPRNIPGSDPAAVPPPRYGEGGKLVPPRFPYIKTRDEQIRDLKRSSVEKTTNLLRDRQKDAADTGAAITRDDEPYDLLVIGAGATGSGIALDAATRGLKVAVVERDDFSAGTSSKSTKLVHGGVRYLEKAVWDLDYSHPPSLDVVAHHGSSKNVVAIALFLGRYKVL